MDFNRKVRESSIPCPFCGKKPRLTFDPIHYSYRLGCKNNTCAIRPHVPFLISNESEGDLKAALIAWNKRVNKKGD